jgi:ribonuclease P protein component
MKRLRFTPPVRLNQADQYARVFRQPIRCSGPYCVLLARKNGLHHARLGLAISKKRAAKAVTRNTLKRIIRESFRHHQQQLQGLDLVVMAKSEASRANKPLIRNSLDRQWSRLAKKCGKSL